jgi:signal transduction histidine kinase
VDLRTQTSLIAAVLSVAIAASVGLRTRKRRVHWLFALFAAVIGAWYLTAFLAAITSIGAIWARVNLVCATMLPVAAVQFFRAFVASDHKRATLLARLSLLGGGVLTAVILTPIYRHIVVASSIFVFVVLMLGGSLSLMVGRARTATSRFDRARVTYLTLVGALAAAFTILDYLPYVGLDLPPVGTVLTLIFLYILSQSIVRSRLLDLYELAGRLTVMTTMAFTLAAIFWVLVLLASGRFFLHSVVAALVVLLLFDPVRTKVEEQISQFFFRERHDLERTIAELRSRLAHVLEVDDVARVITVGLEQSRRVTHASLYLLDDTGRGYDLAGFTGPRPPTHIELPPAHPFLERLRREDGLVLETLERELDERRELGEEREVEVLHDVLETIHSTHASVCVAVRGDSEVYGFLCVRDERLRDAFAPEEVQLLKSLAAQAATAVENSRVYQRMKDRDRLATLGEMAAGLAHEIRNPLGAIKASAQYLAEEPGGTAGADGEFLGIIVDEVDRLNRVVSSFLDYARPSKGDTAPIDVNAAVRRSMQLLGAQCEEAGIAWELALAAEVPPVRIDVEQLRQVLINLVQNALQAMSGNGRLVVATDIRAREDASGKRRDFVEMRVEDTGPGIPQRVLANLFVPFVTTKDRGTGLGLAISQRIVTAVGGHIEVSTHEGVGTTFTVRLPVADDASTSAPLLGAASPTAAQGVGEAGAAGGDGGTTLVGSAGERPSGVTTSR